MRPTWRALRALHLVRALEAVETFHKESAGHILAPLVLSMQLGLKFRCGCRRFCRSSRGLSQFGGASGQNFFRPSLCCQDLFG
jgi:hypothetical protein